MFQRPMTKEVHFNLFAITGTRDLSDKLHKKSFFPPLSLCLLLHPSLLILLLGDSSPVFFIMARRIHSSLLPLFLFFPSPPLSLSSKSIYALDILLLFFRRPLWGRREVEREEGKDSGLQCYPRFQPGTRIWEKGKGKKEKEGEREDSLPNLFLGKGGRQQLLRLPEKRWSKKKCIKIRKKRKNSTAHHFFLPRFFLVSTVSFALFSTPSPKITGN